MRPILLLLVLLVPLAEIALFIAAGELFGLWPTLAAVVASAVAGVLLLRSETARTAARLRHALAAERRPVGTLFDGLCVFAAGLLLLTPGFLTDTIGLALLLPFTRALLRGYGWPRLRGHVAARFGGAAFEVVEGEAHEIRDPAAALPPGGRSPPVP